MMAKEHLVLEKIGWVRSDFPSKFGIPRQSGLIEELKATIIFEPAYRKAEALRGLADFSHIWLIWQFSEATRQVWSPTVRPPRLGGNKRMGVFATRSPFRPNPLGLSCVKLEGIDWQSPQGPTLQIAGADLMDGTPIYDIKPYLPFTDSQPNACCGFAAQTQDYALTVECPPELLLKIPEPLRNGLLAVLAHDPRPAYQHDAQRLYGFAFADWEIRFTVRDETLTVCEIIQR